MRIAQALKARLNNVGDRNQESLPDGGIGSRFQRSSRFLFDSWGAAPTKIEVARSALKRSALYKRQWPKAPVAGAAATATRGRN